MQGPDAHVTQVMSRGAGHEVFCCHLDILKPKLSDNELCQNEMKMKIHNCWIIFLFVPQSIIFAIMFYEYSAIIRE